jgi:hypothetical protein
VQEISHTSLVVVDLDKREDDQLNKGGHPFKIQYLEYGSIIKEPDGLDFQGLVQGHKKGVAFCNHVNEIVHRNHKRSVRSLCITGKV